jgi:hypothetical protein
MSDVSVTFEPEKVSVEALAHLGEGHIAYVKQVRSEDVPGLFPQAPKIAPGLKLFALHAADGTPIMLTDSRKRRSPTHGATNCRLSACTETRVDDIGRCKAAH